MEIKLVAENLKNGLNKADTINEIWVYGDVVID